MKTSKILICSTVLVWLLSALTYGAIPILWQADPDGSGVVTNNNSISRVKLTPDKNNVMVFHYNGGAYGIPTRVDKLDASTGNFVWPLPGYKTITKPGQRISLNGWVDGSGNLFIMGSWGGYTIWKYDSELDTELCSYTNYSGFEYVLDAINDELGNLYVAGMTGSWSNDGSRLVKLDSSCNEIWTCLSKNTSDKDCYGRGIALDSSKNVFRVGTDSSYGASDRGRLIGHNASNGAEFLNYTVNETNSQIFGITIDSDDYIYIAYCYGYTTSGQERTVVQKLERVGSTANVVWEYRFDDIGMYLGWGDCIVKHTDNSFYVAFNLRQGGTTLPGIAEFDLNGNLLWKDTIDRPGLWNLSSIDATDNYIYVGLTNYADGSQTQVLCLANTPKPPGPPVANAGDDQIVYADADFTAEVTLDGSGSSDPDGDELTYTWMWTIGSQCYTATGVNPVIELPVGLHTIELVVNDGTQDSAPDQVVITVIAPFQANLWISPRVINRYSCMPNIMALLRLPAGITKDQVDTTQRLFLYPGEIEANWQQVLQCKERDGPQTSILAFFKKTELMEAVPDNGQVELQVVGRLKTGQYFYGTNTVFIINPPTWRPPGR